MVKCSNKAGDAAEVRIPKGHCRECAFSAEEGDYAKTKTRSQALFFSPVVADAF